MANTTEFLRENRLGMKYLIHEISHQETSIKLQGTEKAFIVKVPVQVILASWYKWQILDQRIQEAFTCLNDDEREFILSGLLPEDWNRIFPEGDSGILDEGEE
jgi:hypothetical protein